MHCRFERPTKKLRTSHIGPLSVLCKSVNPNYSFDCSSSLEIIFSSKSKFILYTCDIFAIRHRYIFIWHFVCERRDTRHNRRKNSWTTNSSIVWRIHTNGAPQLYPWIFYRRRQGIEKKHQHQTDTISLTWTIVWHCLLSVIEKWLAYTIINRGTTEGK